MVIMHFGKPSAPSYLVYISLLSQEFFFKKEGRDLENELQKSFFQTSCQTVRIPESFGQIQISDFHLESFDSVAQVGT